MFGIIADLIASVTTVLLPAYISFKALKSSDPAELAPWLIYFVLLTLSLLVESWSYWIIGWLPFYAWIRLGFLLYLVLPQTQGAKVLYLSYVEPFIAQYERNIDEFIGHAHERLQNAGLGYLSQIVDILREKLLGQAAPQQGAEFQNTSAAGYAQNLLSRFAMPDARTNAASLYGIASGAAGLFASMSPPAGRTRDFSSSSDTVNLPSGTNLEKSNYIASERARLANMLRTLEKEQQNIDLAYGSEPSSKTSNLATSHSEASFESISHSDILPIPTSLIPGQKSSQSQKPTTSGNWVTGWFAGAPPMPGEETRPASTGRNVSGQSTGGKGWSAAKEMTDAIQGTSSGVDTGDVEMPNRRY